MKSILPPGMFDATRLTHAGRLTEAAAALQQMLRGQVAPGSVYSRTRRGYSTIDEMDEKAATEIRRPPGTASMSGVDRPPFGIVAETMHPTMPDGLRGLFGQAGRSGLQVPGGKDPSPAPSRVAVPDGAQFLAASFSNHAGSRPYKLYVPSSYRPGQLIPLIVMLHGCTQSPDDFAAGTRMNEAAEKHICLVAYPGQTISANMQKCWNWFSEGDQKRDGGEPSLIAGITYEVMRDYAVDPGRVYIAGLSAGGAAAAIMGDAYPDLYAAIGVHSGLACGAAHDIPSALTAMKRGDGGAMRRAIHPAPSGVQGRVVPTIIFHGDRDTTVNPRNGDAVAAQSARIAALKTRVEKGQVPDGHAYSRTLHADANGQTVIEQWVVHGAGHAWFGGSPAGSYTDPRGPDATKELLRFFLEHPHPMASLTKASA
jgi:poly(hydroxyalkanoate) depolymerase family esterase